MDTPRDDYLTIKYDLSEKHMQELKKDIEKAEGSAKEDVERYLTGSGEGEITPRQRIQDLQKEACATDEAKAAQEAVERAKRLTEDEEFLAEEVKRLSVEDKTIDSSDVLEAAWREAEQESQEAWKTPEWGKYKDYLKTVGNAIYLISAEWQSAIDMFAFARGEKMVDLMARQILSNRLQDPDRIQVIAIPGSGGAGKSTLARGIYERIQREAREYPEYRLEPRDAVILGTDAYLYDSSVRYYKYWGPNGREDRRPVLIDGSMYDMSDLVSAVHSLKVLRQPVKAKATDTHYQTIVEGQMINPVPIIILEGITAANDPRLRELTDLTCAVIEYSDRDRVARKVGRDMISIEEGGTRGYTEDDILRDTMEKLVWEKMDMLVEDLETSADFVWHHDTGIIKMKRDAREFELSAAYKEMVAHAREAVRHSTIREYDKAAESLKKIVDYVADEHGDFEKIHIAIEAVYDVIRRQGNRSIVAQQLRTASNRLPPEDRLFFGSFLPIVLQQFDLVEERKKEFTSSETLAANLFRSEKLNWVVRILLSPAIVAHELAHMLESELIEKWRLSLKRFKVSYLFKGMPGDVRGPPALMGMFANFALGIAGLAIGLKETSGIASLVILILAGMNLLVFCIDLILPIVAPKYRARSDLYKFIRQKEISLRDIKAESAGILIGVVGITEETVSDINKDLGGVKIIALNEADSEANLDKINEYRKEYGAYASTVIDVQDVDEPELKGLVHELINQIEREDRLYFLSDPDSVPLDSKNMEEIQKVFTNLVDRFPAIRSFRVNDLSVYEYKFDKIAERSRIISRDMALAEKIAAIKTQEKTKVASFRINSIAELRWLADEHRRAIKRYADGDEANYPVKLHVRLVDENVTAENLDMVLERSGVSDVINADNVSLEDSNDLAGIYEMVNIKRDVYGEISPEDVVICDARDLSDLIIREGAIDKSAEDLLKKDMLYVQMADGVASQGYVAVIEIVANGNRMPTVMPAGARLTLKKIGSIRYIVVRPITPIDIEELREEIERYEKILIAA